MKRFILILSVLLFANVSANAMYYTGVGGVGHPTHVMSPSGHMRSINNFGTNAPFIRSGSSGTAGYGRMNHMGNRMGYMGGRYPRVGYYNDRFARPRGYYNDYYTAPRNITVSNGPVQISRLNKDYKISTTKKSYTRNGVTYFE